MLVVEAVFIGAEGKDDAAATALGIFLRQRQNTGRPVKLRLRQHFAAAVVGQRVGIVEPAVASGDDVLGRGILQQPGVEGVPAGDGLLPEEESVIYIVGEIAEKLRVEAAVPVFELGSGGEDLVGPGLALAEEEHAHSGQQAEAQENGGKDLRTFDFLFLSHILRTGNR